MLPIVRERNRCQCSAARALVRLTSEVDRKMSRAHRLCHALHGHTVCRPGEIRFAGSDRELGE